MKKILPFSYEDPFFMECWTDFRAGIVNAYPGLHGWYANHLDNICINDYFEVNYGEYEGKYQTLGHYGAVLKSSNRSITSLTRDNIVDYVINQLDNNKYVIIELGAANIYLDKNSDYIMEMIVYGYDTDEELFYSNKQFSFETMRNSFQKRKSVDMTERDRRFNFRQCSYPITLLEVREDYNEEPNLALFYNNLFRHQRRRHYEIIYKTEEQRPWMSEGLCSVYDGFLVMLDKIKSETFNIDAMIHSFDYNYYKLFLFHKQLIWRIQLFNSLYRLNFDEDIYDKLKANKTQLEICSNLAEKYIQTRETEIIDRLYGYTAEISESEEKIMQRLMERVKQNILYEPHYND